MEQHFPSIWFATHEKILSLTKPIVFSNRGCLDILPDQIQYQGKKFTISISRVTAVSMTSQRVPWIPYALMILAVVAYLELMSSGKYNFDLMATIPGASNVLGILKVLNVWEPFPQSVLITGKMKLKEPLAPKMLQWFKLPEQPHLWQRSGKR